ncbi:acyltransferase family protein [Pseudomonas fluorescens]|uniref:acyltransferase family protein n=1 Tax=Pseudomonas fluorescens TaxID=294 RepID=UPI001911EE06|nr:acyltransferase family protein [Pseudomonas fluorescens]
MTSLAEQGLTLTKQSLTHPKYRPDIDGLRAVAVLLVVGYHAFPGWVPGGFIGVDVFFVISGYLISTIIYGSLEHQKFRFTEFYARRIRRIFPALLLVLISCYAFGWFSLPTGEYKQLGKHIAGSASFASNLVLWKESGYFDTAAELKPLLHMWSLGIEEQFYIVWPIILWSAWRMRLNILTLTVILLGASFALNIINIESNPSSTFYFPQTRAWELLSGSVLAYLVLRHSEQSRWVSERLKSILKITALHPGPPIAGSLLRNGQSLIGATLLAIGLLIITQEGFPGWQAIIPCAGAILVISAGPNAWLNKHILAGKYFVWIGLISFPLYLWHWPILSFAKIIEGGMPSREFRIAAVLLSICLAWITYRLELRVRLLANGKLGIIILSTSMAAVGLLGFITYKTDGFSYREPAEIRAISNFKYEMMVDARYSDCWLGAADPYDGFAGKCFISSGNTPGSGVLVWGDSHAARFYPGLNAVIGSNTKILQVTRSSCPPILDFGDSVCAQSNAYILASIEKIKPQTVILFGAWGRYGTDWDKGSAKRSKLLHTLSEIKRAGIQDIIVLGPSPEWTDTLPKIVYNSWKNDYPLHRIPNRLKEGLNPETKKVDVYFREFISKSEANLVPLYDLLCNAEGCMTHVDGDPAKLTSWDYGHLTTDGAKVIASKLVESGVIK